MHNKTKKYKLKPIEIEDPSIVFIKHVAENRPNASFAKHFFTIFCNKLDKVNNSGA